MEGTQAVDSLLDQAGLTHISQNGGRLRSAHATPRELIMPPQPASGAHMQSNLRNSNACFKRATRRKPRACVWSACVWWGWEGGWREGQGEKRTHTTTAHVRPEGRARLPSVAAAGIEGSASAFVANRATRGLRAPTAVARRASRERWSMSALFFLSGGWEAAPYCTDSLPRRFLWKTAKRLCPVFFPFHPPIIGEVDR